MKHPIIAFDIETIGLGGQACFVSWCVDGNAYGKKLRGDKQFTQWFMDELLQPANNGALIFAHYGMKFDLLRLDWFTIAEAGYTGRFYHGKDSNNIKGIDLMKNKKKYKIRDSFCYFPGSLDSFVKTFASKKFKKGKIDFSKTTFDKNKKAHVDYAINDSLVLWRALEGMRAMLNERFGVDLYETVTISGTSYLSMKRSAKADGFEPMLKLDPEYEDIVRGSYHGGMTCAFRLGKFTDVLYLDINSAYAHVMENYSMPTGTPILTVSKPKSKCIKLVEAVIDMGEAFPFLLCEHDGRVGRYSGTIRGWFWECELERQVELGAKVTEHKWLCWPEVDTRQTHYIERCKALRFENYSGALGTLAKLMQNSCYGKHGAALNLFDLVLSLEQPKKGLPIVTTTGELIQALWTVESESNNRSMVHWASYITACVRCELMGLLMRVPREAWLYCDTDSIMIPLKYRAKYKNVIGKAYGQLKIEGKLDSVEIRGPKHYKIKEGRTVTFRTKGIPRKQAAKAWTTGEAVYDAGHSLGVVMRGKQKEGNKYITRTTRRCSSAGNVYCGSYVRGVWTPEAIYDKVVS